jgi:C4-dicarboxylate transporter/malic acid transport protein
VMGTGIVANAAVLLPVHLPGVQTAAIAVWILASTLLVALIGATIAHWALHTHDAHRHHHDPAMAPFYGAPPMALMTVGSGALLVGKHLIGLGPAVRLDEILWTTGTVAGLLSAIAIPYLMFTEHELTQRDVSATWLLPVVPPMVSALTGAGLIAHLPAGQDRLDLLLACLAMFGISLFASVITITLLWGRLALHGPGPAAKIPALWVVLGPLASSITALALLADAAPHAIAARYATTLDAISVLFGVPVWGFSMLWLAIAVAITARTARGHLPFSLTWWSFTFPVGNLVIATSLLALRTHAAPLTNVSMALFAMLVLAWLTTAARTARGALNGGLFLPAAPQPVTVRSVPSPTHITGSITAAAASAAPCHG